ncbi:transcriptional regulator, TetR family [Parvibaculum lavamentivorans DS-1]|uniref:Transcriptional regulator, TetR family n=1 Tax=Parvibaculum lavamentivorans (strain DS-1 / DSM 13023 / NCIMB 13966) TaxID=402881 RepID=A7HRH5_PARL1|nr:TetR/AcrR family transcriptional regulator [Parvibaculum lavamentivorans]ABS62508.1 transcriptional regulator, TetR family [Parvibaculum lavamentivorans DS-1]
MVTKAAQKAAPPRRDRAKTEKAILDAVARLILREGLSGVGVNALAREAGIDKVLIYRYFGNLDGVYRAYAENGDFWWTAEDIIGGAERASTLADALKSGFRRHAAEMRRRPVTLAVIGAETANRTPLVVALEEVRERRALELMDAVFARYEMPEHIDLPALTALLGAAIDYLAARARQIRVYSGVDIKTDKDWERIFATIDAMVDGLFATGKPARRKQKP